MANRVQAALRACYKWALAEELATINPIDGIKARGGRETAKERYLSDAEVVALWALLDGPACKLSNIGEALKLILLTAARPGEVTAMEWTELRDLDGEQPEWHLPRAKTKAARSRVIPLSAQAVSILKAKRKQGEDRDDNPSPYVFPHRTDRSQQASQWAASQLVENLRGQMTVDGKPCPSWTAHDLRRTAATIAGANGVSFEVIQKLLGHADGRVTAVYARYSHAKELREAVDLIADHVAKAGKTRKNEGA